jgi:hypothetical protein
MKDSTRNNIAKGVSSIFGGAHFVLQTAADLTAEAEGTIVSKINKSDKTTVIDSRKLATMKLQKQILFEGKSFAKTFKEAEFEAKMRAKVKDLNVA